MVLETGQYSMQCWHSTRNPDAVDRTKLMYQCLRLIEHLQSTFRHNALALPSADTKNPRNGIEICFLYRKGQTAVTEGMSDYLSHMANQLSLDYHDFVAQGETPFHWCDQERLGNLSILTKPIPEGFTMDDVQKLVDSAKRPDQFRPNDTWRDKVPESQRLPPFSITRSTLQRFHTQENDGLRVEVNSVLDCIKEAKDYTQTAFQLITTLSKGVATLASPTSLEGRLASSWVALSVMSVVTAVETPGTWESRYAIVTLLVVGVLLPITKEATNILLLINDTPNAIYPFTDHIENGERKVVPSMLPAASPNSDFVPCGLFVYIKYQIKGVSLSTYGSAFGVSFDCSGKGNFSIGMDCPNTFAGGSNSIEVHNREHAHDACKMALNSGCRHGWCKGPYVDVKIAGAGGDMTGRNWGRGIVMKG